MVSRPRSRGRWGSGWGVSRPRPRGEVGGVWPGGCLGPDPGDRLGGLARDGGVQAQAWGRWVCIPPGRQLLLWTVRILLECILLNFFS